MDDSDQVESSNPMRYKGSYFFCYAPLVTYLVVDSVQNTRPFARCCYYLNLCGGRIPKSVLWLWITVGRTTAASQIVRPMGKHQPDFPSIPRPLGLVIESSANKWKLCLPWNWLKFNPVVGKGLPKEKGTYLPTQMVGPCGKEPEGGLINRFAQIINFVCSVGEGETNLCKDVVW